MTKHGLFFKMLRLQLCPLVCFKRKKMRTDDIASGWECKYTGQDKETKILKHDKR